MSRRAAREAKKEFSVSDPSLAGLAARYAGWQNLLTGLGATTTDRIYNQRFYRNAPMQPDEAEGLYHGDDLAARICDALPEESLRLPVKVTVKDEPELATSATDELRRLEAQEVIEDAAVWGRCMGGAAIMLGADDGLAADRPLDLKRVRKLLYLDVVDRRELTVLTRYGQDRSARVVRLRVGEEKTRALVKDGQPEVFVFQRGGKTTYVHESRLVILGGGRTSRREREQNSFWDHSVLQRCLPVLQHSAYLWQSVGQIVGNSSQAIMRIKGLFQALAAGQKDVVTARLELVNLMRAHKIMPIDADGEDFTYVSQAFGGLDAMANMAWERLAAAARMPVTVLMGRSPAGLNATGESDIRNWYDRVRSYQQTILKKAFERVLAVVFNAQEGPFSGKEPKSWDLEFPSSWQMSPSEEATYRQQVAASDQIWINAGVITKEEAARSHFRPEGFSADITIDWEERERLEKEKEEELKKNPPPPPPVPGAPPQGPGVPPGPGERPAPAPSDSALENEEKQRTVQDADDPPDFGAEAAAIAARGLMVFQVEPGGRDALEEHGYRNATTDPEEIARRWQANPTANIGIAPGKSGMVVIDVDDKNGKTGSAWMEHHGEHLPKTLTTKSPHGRHLYYRLPKGAPDIVSRVGYLAPGVDIRGTRGSIVAPPSRLADGSVYAWENDLDIAECPAWLLAAMTRERAA